MRKLPFVHVPKLKSTAIGSEEDGILYFLERGGIAPNENPVDIQEGILKQQKISKLFKLAESRLAKDRNITIKEARKILRGVGTGEVEVDTDSVEYEDLLTPEELTEFYLAQGNPREFEIKVATLFIRRRILYPVVLSAPANPKVNVLSVKPLSKALNVDDRIDFQDFKVKITEFADEGEEVIKVEKVPGKLDIDAVGFLMEDGIRWKIGCEDWTQDDTECMTNLIHEIYRFYCRELKLPDPDAEIEADKDGDEVEDSDPLETTTENPKLLTGNGSTTGSPGLELVTNA